MLNGLIISKPVFNLLLVLVGLVRISVREFHRPAVGVFHDLVCCYSGQMFYVLKIRGRLNRIKGVGQMTVAARHCEIIIVARDLGEEVCGVGALFELFFSGVGVLRAFIRLVYGNLSTNEN